MLVADSWQQRVDRLVSASYQRPFVVLTPISGVHRGNIFRSKSYPYDITYVEFPVNDIKYDSC